MKREKRYLVIKHKDVEQYLTATEQLILYILAEKIDAHRINRGKEPLQCVVVEHDWPEYEPTWKAIEARVDNSENKIAKITGSEINFHMEVPEKNIKVVCQDIWDNPEKYSDYKNGSDAAWSAFIRFLWVEMPDGSTQRLADIVHR